MVVPHIIFLLAVVAQVGGGVKTTKPTPSPAEGKYDNSDGSSNTSGAGDDTTNADVTTTVDTSTGQVADPDKSQTNGNSTVKPHSDERTTLNIDTVTDAPIGQLDTKTNGQPGTQATEQTTKINNQTAPTKANVTKFTSTVTRNPSQVTERDGEVTENPKESTTTVAVTDSITEHSSTDVTVNVTDKPSDSKTTIIDDTTGTAGDQMTPNSTSSNTNKPTTESLSESTTTGMKSRWLDIFIGAYHFDGWYTYGGAKNLFDFVTRYVHPNDVNTLVANFYDEAGAVLEMNGTSYDGKHVTFTLDKLYTPTYRFPINQPFEIAGIVISTKVGYKFMGNVTKPENSPFEMFSMIEGKGPTTTADEMGAKIALIVAIPAVIGFLGILGTVWLICWATRKGYLRKHKTYKLFSNSRVAYESVAETVHI